MACRFCRAVLALYRASLPRSQPGGGSTAPRHLGSHHHMSQCKPSAATPLLLFLLYFALYSWVYFPTILLLAFYLLPKCSIPLYFSFIIPSTPHFMKTWASSLNFIPSFSTPFPTVFSHFSFRCTLAVYPGFSSYCCCCNILLWSRGPPPKGKQTCFHVKLPPSALQSIFSVPAAEDQLARTVLSWQHMTLLKYSVKVEVAGIVVPVQKQGGSLTSSVPVQNYALISQQVASIVFHWPSRRARSLVSSWLINLHVTGHDGEGICRALLFEKQLAEFQLL